MAGRSVQPSGSSLIFIAAQQAHSPDPGADYFTQLDKILSTLPFTTLLEQKTRIPKTYFASGIAVVISVLIFLNIWASLLTNVIGFTYPAYMSFKAIESVDKRDDTQWLIYWTIFGFFNTIEFFSGVLLHWVPFYYPFKMAFLLYLHLPYFRGAEYLYETFIRPYLLSSSTRGERQFQGLKEKASFVIGQLNMGGGEHVHKTHGE
ncbi:ER membrane protein DP1/Yop1 [Rhizophlyctis rosea]|uniref:Protein YOP1 n=1 Tax=Rhizophlyctis rosea TaxID=64517 RepID=A0AAD5SGX1_9FUNG|nr:ER membrane protein DP1/Yop1 [Rhizophlyctis rosea]